MKDLRSSLLLLLLLASLLLNGYFIYQRKTTGLIVSEVIDGDTLIVTNGEHIRLLGINAPEEGRCYASEAKDGLTDLVLHKQIRIEEERKDAYGRRMGLVYVGDDLINTKLVALGLGKPDYTKNSQSQQFIDAYEQAKAQELGVNSDLCKKTNVDLPPDPNCVIKGNIDKATGKKYYHLPTCSHYSQIVLDLDTQEGYFCSEQEAQKAGFIKAAGCE